MKSRSVRSNQFGLTLVAIAATYIVVSPVSAYAGVGTAGMACGGLVGIMEGSFGALVAAAAGVGAIVAAAVGGFKAAWSLVVVSIGAFILRSYLTLYNTGCAGRLVDI